MNQPQYLNGNRVQTLQPSAVRVETTPNRVSRPSYLKEVNYGDPRVVSERVISDGGNYAMPRDI